MILHCVFIVKNKFYLDIHLESKNNKYWNKMLWIISSLKHDTKYIEVHKDNNNYAIINLIISF